MQNARCIFLSVMPRGKKQQASVGFCKECNAIVQAFYIYNKKENKDKTPFRKKYCKNCRKITDLKIKDEKK